MAVLVFHVVGVGDGFAEIDLVLDDVTGNVFAGASGQDLGPLTLTNLIMIPEPNTTLLVSLGLAGLGFAARRRAKAFASHPASRR